MKRIVAMILNIAFIVGMTSCGNMAVQESKTSTKQTSIERNDDMVLLNKDELIKLCGLSNDEYEDKDLDAFIHYYKFTEDNVKLFNIHNLLANFEERRNVESIFNEVYEKQINDFTQNVDCIAFVENKNTTVNSIYIDVKNNRRWAYKGDYIFYDLNKYNYEDISNEDIDTLLSNIYDLGVFTLSDMVNSSKDTSDPMSFTFVVKYMDGSCFRVRRTGIPSDICPEYYSQWHNLMF